MPALESPPTVEVNVRAFHIAAAAVIVSARMPENWLTVALLTGGFAWIDWTAAETTPALADLLLLMVKETVFFSAFLLAFTVGWTVMRCWPRRYGMRGYQRIGIDAGGLYVDSCASTTVHKWVALYPLIVLPMLMVVRVTPYMFITMPRRGFSSNAAFLEFADALRRGRAGSRPLREETA